MIPSDVQKLIWFHENQSTRDIQNSGVAGLWNILKSRPFVSLNKPMAYLADEVGMGKTYQAMGVVALFLLDKWLESGQEKMPRVAIICPGETLQRQWQEDWNNFLTKCWLCDETKSEERNFYDGLLLDSLTGTVSASMLFHERLKDFASSLMLDQTPVHVLRYSSFSRPIQFQTKRGHEKEGRARFKAVFESYMSSLQEIGINELNQEESSLKDEYSRKYTVEHIRVLTRKLNRLYSIRVGALLEYFPFDMIVFDEAQYLRHVDNSRNANIREVFKPNKKNTAYLFLSATPIHTHQADILALDKYLGTTAFKNFIKEKNGDENLVPLFKKIMVRRCQSYGLGTESGKSLNKGQYRSYELDPINKDDNPWYMLTQALVQKNLVQVLQGRNNQFRMGEYSSFESLKSSIQKKKKDKDGNIIFERETDDADVSSSDDERTSPDREFLNRLVKSFNSNVLTPPIKGQVMGEGLPHAKMDSIVDEVFEQCLIWGSNQKRLIFARRLDTVDDLHDRLLNRYQEHVDERIKLWKEVFSSVPEITAYWGRNDDESSIESYNTDINGLDELSADEEIDELKSLNYYRHMRREKGKGHFVGILFNFRRVLTLEDDSPFAFLVRDVDSDSFTDEDHKDWISFHSILMKGQPYSEVELNLGGSISEKRRHLALRRALLQSMRSTDFLVDLDIISRYGSGEGRRRKKSYWKPKFFEILSGEAAGLPEKLQEYMECWRIKMQSLILHFDLITQKCFPDAKVNHWQNGVARVDTTFGSLMPVVRRSGRYTGELPPRQFKLPVSPNVLVCTDVLKEGVNLHLFCDDVSHYGIAWTSGDLEQRIGRVDRFEGLLDRKLRNSREQVEYPKLKVQFPALSGTLDEKQVERVVAKMKSTSLVLDFGKSLDERKETTLDELYQEVAISGQESAGASLEPDFCNMSSEKWDLNILYEKGKPNKFLLELMNNYMRDNIQCSHRKSFGLLYFRIPEEKNEWRGFAVPDHIVMDEKFKSDVKFLKQLLDMDEAMYHEQAYAWLEESSVPEGFHFDKKPGTFIRNFTINSLFDTDGGKRKQQVILEANDNWIYMRSMIHADCHDPDVLMAKLKRNSGGGLPCHFDISSGHVWMRIRIPKLFWKVGMDVWPKAASSLAKIADYLQAWHTFEDDSDDIEYQSIIGLDSFSGIKGKKERLNELKNLVMNINKVENYNDSRN